MSKKLEEELKKFEQDFHPMHFYDVLRHLGMEIKPAKRWAEIYELGIYRNVLEEIKETYKWKRQQ